MSDKSMTVLQLWGMNPVEAWRGSVKPVPTVNDTLIAGVELEIENLVDGVGTYMDRAGRFWNVVEDGSLRPRGLAWEFVSRPAPLNVLLGELDVFFGKMRLSEQNYTDRCSVHVHTNVQDFTREQLGSLSLIYPVFEEVLFQYVNHYKKQEEQGYCRDTNLYCIPWSSCRMNRKFISRFFEGLDGSVRHWQKYTALNLLPIREHGTVEWRHMHGTCDMEKLTTWINMIGAIMKYVKERSFEDIIKTIKIMNDVSTYKQFFEEVLLGTLPYEEQYRGLLREGILNAKYSLMDFDPTKVKEVSLKSSKSLDRYRWDNLAREEDIPDVPIQPLNTGAARPQPQWGLGAGLPQEADDWLTQHLRRRSVAPTAPDPQPTATVAELNRAHREAQRPAEAARVIRPTRNRT